MPRYTVSPKRGDRSGWKVESNGRKVSSHRRKDTAMDKARELARKHGGTITVQRADGTFQKRINP